MARPVFFIKREEIMENLQLPQNKALVVVGIILLILLFCCCCLIVAFALLEGPLYMYFPDLFSR